MKDLLKKEYLHLGTDHIYKELWQNIQMDQLYQLSKPYGGLWTSHTRFQNNRLCDWIDYLADDEYELERLKYQKSCLVKFKENIRFLEIKNNNDFKNLEESGLIKKVTTKLEDLNYTVRKMPNYEKISELYDLLYIDFDAHPSLKNYCFNTMLALNPEAIEYYAPVSIDIDAQKITKREEKKKITEPDQKYYELVKHLNNTFKDIEFNGNYQEYILKLNSFKNDLLNVLKTDIKGKYLDDVNTNILIDTIIQNLYREKYLEKQKILLKQA